MIRLPAGAFRLFSSLLLLCISLTSTAEPRQGLKFDPFSKPELSVVEAPAYEAELDVSAERVVIEAPALPKLRAILHSSNNTLVNLDGDLVAVGATYQGYRVAAVGARDVVLLDDDETHVISIDQKGDDDARLP